MARSFSVFLALGWLAFFGAAADAADISEEALDRDTYRLQLQVPDDAAVFFKKTGPVAGEFQSLKHQGRRIRTFDKRVPGVAGSTCEDLTVRVQVTRDGQVVSVTKSIRLWPGRVETVSFDADLPALPPLPAVAPATPAAGNTPARKGFLRGFKR